MALTIHGYHGNMVQHYRLIVWERPLTTWWSWGSNSNGKKNGHGHFTADYSDTYEAILWTLYLGNSLIAPLFLTFNNVHIDNDSFIAWTTISWGFFLWVLFQHVVWCNKRWANKHDDWLLSQPALHWANVVSKHNDQQHRTAAGISWITSSLLQ